MFAHSFKIVMVLLCSFITTFIRAYDPSFSDGEELGLMIVGTITNTRVEDNVALVKETESGKIKAVKLGYSLLDEYQVTEVTTKYMLLSKGDKKYLVFQNKFASQFAHASQKIVPRPATNLMTGQYTEHGFERQGGKITVTNDYVAKLVNEDLSKILMQATAIPKIEDGQIIGFSLLQIDAGSIFEKAGFRNEDVVTVINGTKLNSVAGAISMLKSVKGSAEVDVEFIRDGSPQKLAIRVH